MNNAWRDELRLLTKGNEEYAKFNKRIVNTNKTVIGVRVPDLRRLAKVLAKNIGDESSIRQFLLSIDNQIFEEVMLAGLVLNAAKLDEKDHINLTKLYLKKVDSWAEIDIFVEKKPHFKTKAYWDFANKLMKSNKEFCTRYGVIMCMSNFLDKDHLSSIFKALKNLGNDKYYVKMACAWLYAEVAVNFYDEVIKELNDLKIDLWVKKKAYQKMIESTRITDENKVKIRLLRIGLS